MHKHQTLHVPEMREKGAEDPAQVFLLTMDETGKLYYIPGEAKA